MTRFVKSALRQLLTFASTGIPKKLIKVIIGSGSLYGVAIKIYLKMQHEIQPKMIRNDGSFFQILQPLKPPAHKIIYVDITSLTRGDAGGGIQRTQKKFLEYTLCMKGVSVVPIASEGSIFYRVLVDTTDSEIQISLKLSNEVVSIGENDVFLSLDLNYLSLISNFDFYIKLSKQGTNIWFLIYDLLPIDYPNYFLEGTAELHDSWLNNLLKIANTICISKAVQDNLDRYMFKKKIARKNLLNLQLYLGADLYDTQNYSLVRGVKIDTKKFIAVGTLEPRKGYEEILDVCEKLWAQGEIFEMHFIGKLGWKSEGLKNRVTLQSGLNPYLFWHSTATDQELDFHYATCDALIAASFDEGFGLPIVEALRRQKVVFARKIEIFEEVIGKSEHLFESKKDLELKLSEYLQDPMLEKFKVVTNFKSRSWQDTIQEIIDTILVCSCTDSKNLR